MSGSFQLGCLLLLLLLVRLNGRQPSNQQRDASWSLCSGDAFLPLDAR